jgi:Cu-Zn family superoxide dismutase
MIQPILLILALAAPPGPAAQAVVKDASGATVATAAFHSVANGVRVEVTAMGLPAGSHGFHLHAAGACQGPDFKSAGGHFNPGGRQHGLENPQGHHAGDLPNLVVAADGTGSASATLSGVTLGTGPDSLFHDGGTALVIHAAADDMKSDPAGNSGARIACGAVVRAP